MPVEGARPDDLVIEAYGTATPPTTRKGATLMAQFRAEINGETVWTGRSKDGSVKNFPEEYRRPEGGEVHLFIDDELVSVAVPSEESE